MTDSQDGPDDAAEDAPGDSLEELADSIAERRSGDADASSAPDGTGYSASLEELAAATAPPRDDGERSDPGPSAVGDIEPGTNVLVLGALRGDACERSCADLLAEAGSGDPENVLFVTVTHSAESRLEVLREHADAAPTRVAVIRTGSNERKRTRSAGGSEGSPEEVAEYGVDDPSDLTRLGITVTRTLNEWTATSRRTAVCLHSLTGLLQYVDQQRLFRFVHILQAKLAAADATAHFHMDPGSHGPETVSVFRSLFDTVVEVDPEGGVTVTSDDG